VTGEQLAAIEREVNAGVWQSAPVSIKEEAYPDAVARGAMALFGEKYGDVVRVVEIPALSVELCGGTHVRNTSEIGLLRIISEGGVAAGVRRIEAVTGPRAFQFLADREKTLLAVAGRLKVPMTGYTSGAEQIEKKLESLMDDRKQLEKRLDDAMRGMLAANDFAGAYNHARREGRMLTVQEAALAKVREGMTTPEEVARVLATGAVVALVGNFWLHRRARPAPALTPSVAG
jgi:alanyl-tRNA synthetase